jgi:hypothetical protein
MMMMKKTSDTNNNSVQRACLPGQPATLAAAASWHVKVTLTLPEARWLHTAHHETTNVFLQRLLAQPKQLHHKTPRL